MLLEEEELLDEELELEDELLEEEELLDEELELEDELLEEEELLDEELELEEELLPIPPEEEELELELLVDEELLEDDELDPEELLEGSGSGANSAVGDGEGSKASVKGAPASPSHPPTVRLSNTAKHLIRIEFS